MKKSLGLFGLLCICVLFLEISVQAQNQNVQEEVVGKQRGPGTIYLVPQGTYPKYVLTVSGPKGVFFRKEYSGNGVIGVDVVDSNGKLLPDGNYVYEIAALPLIDQNANDIMSKARETGDMAEVDALRSGGILPTSPSVKSGYFNIHNGAFVTDQATEVSGGGSESTGLNSVANDTDSIITTDDQVIADDLIVNGSICVGDDCVNGESFGFDTIRLKENNVRLKFIDTSSTSSFPSRDWQLTANDSANGGLDKFSIDDIDGGRTPFTIEAGAPSHSLYVDDSGRIGLGTSTPVVQLHEKDGNTPTLRLEQDGSSGFTAQAWDVAGNEANFFIRDVTNGSKLPFQIKPGAPTSSIYTAANGNVGLGTDSPGTRLQLGYSIDTQNALVFGEYETASDLQLPAIQQKSILDPGVSQDLTLAARSGVGGILFYTGDDGSSYNVPLLGAASNALRMVINSAGRVGIGMSDPSYTLHVDGTAFFTGVEGSLSDIRHKKNVQPISDGALNIIDRFRPVTFEWKDPVDSGMKGVQIGFIAQEIEKVLPELVMTQDDKDQTKGLKYNRFIPVLVKAMKELNAANDSVKKDNAVMKIENNQLRKELLAIKERQSAIENMLLALSIDLPKEKLAKYNQAGLDKDDR